MTHVYHNRILGHYAIKPAATQRGYKAYRTKGIFTFRHPAIIKGLFGLHSPHRKGGAT